MSLLCHRARAATLMTLFACGSPTDTSDPNPSSVVLELPVDGQVTPRRGRMSLVLHLGHDPNRIVWWSLDGDELLPDDPVVRPRIRFLGGGFDQISTIDTSALSPGTHEVVAHGLWGEAGATIDVPDTRHRVDLALTDGSAPLSGRVFVRRDGEAVDLTTGIGMDHQARDIGISHVDIVDGEGSVWLEPGTYELWGWRGLRGGLAAVTHTVDADSSVSIAVPTEVEDPSVLVDLHVHTGRSGDSWIPDVDRVESIASSGLDAFVITDHNRAHVPSALLDAAPGMSGVRGSELDLRVMEDDVSIAAGHLNAFPLVDDADDYLEARTAEPIADSLARLRASPIAAGPIVLQLNHPRGIQFQPEEDPKPQWELFDRMGFVHDSPLGEGANAWMGTAEDDHPGLDFDAIELMNRFSYPLYEDVRADWFHLLDQGVRLTATGNSDSHGISVETIGFAGNRIHSGPAWTEALLRGEASITTGIFVDLSVDGVAVGGTATGPAPTASVRVQAPGWVPVGELRLVQDGEQVWSAPIDDGTREPGAPLDRTFTVPLTVVAEGWVVAEAAWATPWTPEPPYSAVAPGYVPMGLTNPVFVAP